MSVKWKRVPCPVAHSETYKAVTGTTHYVRRRSHPKNRRLFLAIHRVSVLKFDLSNDERVRATWLHPAVSLVQESVLYWLQLARR